MDFITELKQKAKEEYHIRLRQIDRQRNIYRKANILELKLKEAFPQCSISTRYEYCKPSVSLYLTENLNIAKDVNMFLEEEDAFIQFLLDGAELSAKDYAGTSYDIDLECVTLEVYYQGGNCTRVKVREEVQVVPVYEVVCN